jgi:hypothetical protein
VQDHDSPGYTLHLAQPADQSAQWWTGTSAMATSNCWRATGRSSAAACSAGAAPDGRCLIILLEGSTARTCAPPRAVSHVGDQRSPS